MKFRQDRRKFLKTSGAGALGAMALGAYACNTETSSTAPVAAEAATNGSSIEVGIQLYGVRDEMAKSVPETLKAIKSFGYQTVELADYANGQFYGYAPAEFKKMASDAGLKIVSSHSQVESAGIDLDGAKLMAEAHAELGAEYCIYPWVEATDRSIDFYNKMVETLNEIGQYMKDVNVQFGYHNHNFDFANLNGTVPYYDIFMKGMDPELMTFEIDLYWALKAGQDPVEMFNKYPGRFQLFHLKDMKEVSPAPFYEVIKDDICPVGTGEIDYKPIMAESARETAGFKYMFVEDDNQGNGFGLWSAKNSIENIKASGLLG